MIDVFKNNALEELGFTMDQDDFFEGAEKTLKISYGQKQDGNLKNIPRNAMEMLLNQIGCKVLSYNRSKKIDEYLLSESSLFIGQDYFEIKTCGKINTLEALPLLKKYILEYTNYDEEPSQVMYYRKEFLKPESQTYPHTNFENETEYLKKHYKSGIINCSKADKGKDSFFLILAHSNQISNPQKETKLELMMSELDMSKMNHYHNPNNTKDASETTLNSSIYYLLPWKDLQQELFQPCGYSMNGVVNGEYFGTIHITPQEAFSYASFSTNFPIDNMEELICKVLKIFNPKTFILLIANNGKIPTIKDYSLTQQNSKFDTMEFAHYEHFS